MHYTKKNISIKFPVICCSCFRAEDVDHPPSPHTFITLDAVSVW